MSVQLPAIRRVDRGTYAAVGDLARMNVLLPRRSWQVPAETMLLNGLRIGRWCGIGVYDAEQLVAYLDFKLDIPRVEIGFMLTHPQQAGRGHQGRLVTELRSIALRNAAGEIGGHTSVGNGAARRVFERAGFLETAVWANDRVDGTATVRYRLAL